MLSKRVDRPPTLPGITDIAGTEPNDRERRRRTRVLLRWPLCFFGTGSSDAIETVTHNLSSEGFYCIANTPFIPGEIRECTLGVPTNRRNGGEPIQPIQCRVRVIRVEALGESGPFGIGCRIEDYCFIRPDLVNREPRSHTAAAGNY
jgi:hypothetical protein